MLRGVEGAARVFGRGALVESYQKVLAGAFGRVEAHAHLAVAAHIDELRAQGEYALVGDERYPESVARRGDGVKGM